MCPWLKLSGHNMAKMKARREKAQAQQEKLAEKRREGASYPV